MGNDSVVQLSTSQGDVDSIRSHPWVKVFPNNDQTIFGEQVLKTQEAGIGNKIKIEALIACKIVKISLFPSFNYAKNSGKQESNESEALFSKKVKEDNDVPEMTSDAILAKWLADGKKALKKQLRSLSQLAVQAMKPLHGPYKKQGTTQSVRTQQNNKKKAKDAYNKVQSDGYEDIVGMFSRVSACVGRNDMAGEAENGGVVSNGSDSASVEEIGLSVDAGDEACSSDIEVDEHGNIAAEVIEDEEGLGPLLDIFSSSFRSDQLVSMHHWLPENPRGLFRPPPTNEAVDKCIQ
ncbi:hypothetical protein ARMGADRAFT_1038916 [Armillaria gallica]|uniref:Uncharacterized protein n=1 Tax=Armillaria gallica TaxID=47427 RepID=A0A2H3CG34_ARMGA|nr:hypothetical protein ARMGADRAFT_1038916 [Armillaria gallica]